MKIDFGLLNYSNFQEISTCKYHIPITYYKGVFTKFQKKISQRHDISYIIAILYTRPLASPTDLENISTFQLIGIKIALPHCIFYYYHFVRKCVKKFFEIMLSNSHAKLVFGKTPYPHFLKTFFLQKG